MLFRSSRLVMMKVQLVMGVCLVVVFARSAVRAAPFDHGRWEKILRSTVSEDGWVDYRSIREKWSGELETYIEELGKASPEKLIGASEKEAFWINAYNAICVKKLLDHKLPATVPHAVFFGKNIFKERTYRVAGKPRSLDDIEHRILRRSFKDRRVHAALVCGASSCPRLRPEAYSGKKLAQQLDEECRRWVQVGKDKKGRRKNYLDREKKIFYVSKIFDWYQEDFDDSAAGVLRFIRKYAAEEDRKFLESQQVRVRYLDYDWALNGKGR